CTCRAVCGRRTRRTPTPSTNRARASSGMASQSVQHPALEHVFTSVTAAKQPALEKGRPAGERTTSLSLARARAAGLLSRLDPSRESVNIWDPAAGTGFAGSLLIQALRSADVQTRYRGQEIDVEAAAETARRLDGVADAEVAAADTLAEDAFEDFAAD